MLSHGRWLSLGFGLFGLGPTRGRTIPLNLPRRCRSGARSSKDCGSSRSICHSADTFSRPRNRNLRIPPADLIMPNTGSTMCLCAPRRELYQSPYAVCSASFPSHSLRPRVLPLRRKCRRLGRNRCFVVLLSTCGDVRVDAHFLQLHPPLLCSSSRCRPRSGIGVGVPSAAFGCSIHVAFRLSRAAWAIGTACCLSFASFVVSAATMICSARSTTRLERCRNNRIPCCSAS